MDEDLYYTHYSVFMLYTPYIWIPYPGPDTMEMFKNQKQFERYMYRVYEYAKAHYKDEDLSGYEAWKYVVKKLFEEDAKEQYIRRKEKVKSEIEEINAENYISVDEVIDDENDSKGLAKNGNNTLNMLFRNSGWEPLAGDTPTNLDEIQIL